jgi:hypothetical protein
MLVVDFTLILAYLRVCGFALSETGTCDIWDLNVINTNAGLIAYLQI